MGELTVLGQVKGFLSQDSVKKRFNEVLGAKAPQFMASITNTIESNTQLKKCDASSIMSAAFVAATYDLPIDPNLGFSAIVPYKDKAQFQIMYKGFVQLAIRSGTYENMNVSEVYEDELVSYNPITGELTLTSNFSSCAQRKNGEKDKIVGYYAWFRLLTGFRKEMYMTLDECKKHAETYSASYRQDLKKGCSISKWSTDFHAMSKKTVLKLLLSKWGVLSVDMQRAIIDDQKVFTDDNGTYEDNENNSKKQEEIPNVFSQQEVKEDAVEQQ